MYLYSPLQCRNKICLLSMKDQEQMAGGLGFRLWSHGYVERERPVIGPHVLESAESYKNYSVSC